MKIRMRNPKRIPAICSIGFAVFVAGAATVLAVDDDDVFELGPGVSTDEGGLTNILGDGSVANGPDWTDLFDGNGNLKDSNGNGTSDAEEIFGATAATFIKDDLSTASSTDRTTFTESNKNEDLIATWNWSSGNVPAKDDIANAYAFATVVGSDLVIYAGIERLDPSGDSHVDVEFNKNRIGLDKDPNLTNPNVSCGNDGVPAGDKKPCEFTNEKSAGDVVVSMDFLQGGGLGTVTVHRWDGTQYVDVDTLTGEGCNPGDTICAFNNGGLIDGGPWDNFDNHASTISNLETNAFTEFGVNINDALNLTTAPCFATVQVKTRSSGSFSAELKDFALKGFAQCSANVTTEIHSGASVGPAHTATDIQNTTVPVLTVIHDKAIVAGLAGFPTPTGTVDFARFSNNDCSGTPVNVQNNVGIVDQSNGTATAESASFTTAAGFVSYKAHYDGDTNYPQKDGPCERLTVTKLSSAVTTIPRVSSLSGPSVLNKAVHTGTTIVDVATITGNTSGGPDPTGDVTFQKCSSANCSNCTAQVVTLTSDSDPNDGIATAVSPSATPGAGTFLSYRVTYEGDGVYNGSSESACEPMCIFTFVPAP